VPQQERAKRSLRALNQGIEKLKAALLKHSTQTQLADELQLSRSTVSRMLAGKPVERDNFEKICDALELDWREIADLTNACREEEGLLAQVDTKVLQPHNDINWQQLCRTYLQLQRSLASNLFSAGMGIRFALDELHIPLGLVERPQKSQRWEDFDPALGSRVYQEEKSIPIDYDDFFDRVLAQGQSPKSRGLRLAIIGEPGAGKTVQLLKISDWLLNQAVGLPIWISLGAVGNKPLDQYLTEDWLRMALGKAGLMSVHAEAACKFEQLLNQGQVWLLLDGVDEMSVPNPLRTLAKQLKVPLLQNVRVVLTCRVNLWDAISNALDEFDTYKMLDFSFGDGNKPNQVKQFIDNWFSSSNPLSGLRLWQQLNQTGMTRIKDSARNPLRLALLCLTWAKGPETLPKTKAGLYKVFVQALYRLKEKVFPTTLRERSDLNAAFGKLALQAFARGYKSVFPSDLVEKELNEGELFEKALELAWLNQVGVEKDNWSQPIYAFFHPTFAEYFAALAIDDWRFFLNHIPDNPSHSNVSYRIFERQWKEVILLWLGREDVLPTQKETLIRALVEFDDGCYNFYWFRAYLLAAAGIAEIDDFNDSNLADRIVTNLVNWTLSDCNGYDFQQLETLSRPLVFAAKREAVVESAYKALKETKPNRVIAHLTLLKDKSNDETIRELALEILEDVDPSRNNRTLENTATNLPSFSTLASTEPLPKNDSQDSLARIYDLIRSLKSPKSKFSLRNSIFELGKIAFDNKDAIIALENLLLITTENDFQWYICCTLLQIAPGHASTVSYVLDTLHQQSSSLFPNYNFLLEHLSESQRRETVTKLKDCIMEPIDVEPGLRPIGRYAICCDLIWHCAQNMPYPEFYKAFRA
jgi:DNA-binding Xre family transcriptional regulator